MLDNRQGAALGFDAVPGHTESDARPFQWSGALCRALEKWFKPKRWNFCSFKHLLVEIEIPSCCANLLWNVWSMIRSAIGNLNV